MPEDGNMTNPPQVSGASLNLPAVILQYWLDVAVTLYSLDLS